MENDEKEICDWKLLKKQKDNISCKWEEILMTSPLLKLFYRKFKVISTRPAGDGWVKS